jgi:hypothetical protein
MKVTAIDTPIVLSRATSNALSIVDPDRQPHALVITLVAKHGTLTLATTRDLRIGAGEASLAASVTVEGTAEAINRALDGLTFAPAKGYSGTAGVCVDASHPPRRTDIESLCLNRAEALSDASGGPRVAVWMSIAVEARSADRPGVPERAREPEAPSRVPPAAPRADAGAARRPEERRPASRR